MGVSSRRKILISLAILGSIGVTALFAGARHEWKDWQGKYNALRREHGLGEISIAVRSLHTEVGEERCCTCHLGTVIAPETLPPFETHPELSCTLPLSKQGCSTCHRGDPRAVDSEAAHARRGFGKASLLGGQTSMDQRFLTQAGCAACHASREDGSLHYSSRIVPDIAEGMRLYIAQGCPSCHRIEGLYHAPDRGPDLTRIGERRNIDSLYAVLRSPTPSMLASSMPPVRMREDELRQLSLFLSAQLGPNPAKASNARSISLAEEILEPTPVQPSAAVGARWARLIGCDGCHKLDASEQGIIDLTRVGFFRTETELREILVHPGQELPQTVMPSFELPDSVAESIVLWLVGQRAPLPSAPTELFQNVCAPCHSDPQDQGVRMLRTTPPVLDKSNIDRERFINVAFEGVPHTAMSAWGKLVSRALLGAMYDGLK